MASSTGSKTGVSRIFTQTKLKAQVALREFRETAQSSKYSIADALFSRNGTDTRAGFQDLDAHNELIATKAVRDAMTQADEVSAINNTRTKEVATEVGHGFKHTVMSAKKVVQTVATSGENVAKATGKGVVMGAVQGDETGSRVGGALKSGAQGVAKSSGLDDARKAGQRFVKAGQRLTEKESKALSRRIENADGALDKLIEIRDELRSKGIGEDQLRQIESEIEASSARREDFEERQDSNMQMPLRMGVDSSDYVESDVSGKLEFGAIDLGYESE